MNPLEELGQLMKESGISWEKKVALKRHEYLKVKGSIDTNIYFVESGSLRIFMDDEHEEHTIRFGYSGDIIASLDSLLSGKPSQLYIQALRKSVIWKMKKSTFMGFIEKDVQHILLWKKILEKMVYEQMEREVDILTYSPEKRYARVLERSPRLFQEIPLKYIASYLRMSPETLSRINKS